MVASNCRIGIIGAGASGVYLAILLIQQGFQVSLFEKAPYPRTYGCGIFIVQSGMKALYQGVPEICQNMIDLGVAVKTFEFRNLRGGLINSESVSYEENELPGILIHRKTVLETLLDALPPDCLRFNSEFKSVTQTDHKVIAEFKDGSSWEGDLLVGADGILSKVRPFVASGIKLCYLGDIVWRGVVSDQVFCPEGHFIVYARGRGIYANFYKIDSDRTHWGFFLEKEQEPSEVGLINPHNTTLPPEELAKLPDDARAVIESTPPEQMVCHYSHDIELLPQIVQGRIVLIGDAAHAKSATRSKGMASGWEDALSLSRYLAADADIPKALEHFQSERLPIVHEYQRTSREISQKIGRRHKAS
jgi:salicylate hydroxylase